MLGSSSYLSCDDRRLLIGLGAAEQADAVTIRWPSGREESWGPLVKSQTHYLIEGHGIAR
jgi:hypothetical protein